MQLLIDSNIYLGFYANPKDKRTALAQVLANANRVFFPDQIWREFQRNRGNLLGRNIEALKQPAPHPQLAFIEDSPLSIEVRAAFEAYRSSLQKLREHVADIRLSPSSDPLLEAVRAIYEASERPMTTELVVERARMRCLRGDPPMTAEKKAIGDEIIWEHVLERVTDDLVLVSKDKAFSTHSAFLADEFRVRTTRTLVVTDRISAALEALGDTAAARIVAIEEADAAQGGSPADLAQLGAPMGMPCPRCQRRAVGLEPLDNGWGLYFDGGLVIQCTSDTCQQAPTVGETARLYGKGFGYAVRGIIVDRRVYRYHTEHEQHELEQKAEKEAAVRAAAKLDVERADRDARRATLPEMFQRRLNEFEKSIPDWRQDSESSELAVCEDAARIVRHCPDTAALRHFLSLSPEEQRAAVPGLRAGQTGNTWSRVCQLVTDYLCMN